ncbi:hypothetical protein RLV_2056 (plasmid) [Rhizobium leguminosarum bv. viciae]|nr:hypothetical protein RLV_2056 [Rhizobium leguminosarum bv. viciae]
MHANQVKQWKDQLLDRATCVFGYEAKAEPANQTVDVETLHAKFGELKRFMILSRRRTG